jgi:hypothetical protein
MTTRYKLVGFFLAKSGVSYASVSITMYRDDMTEKGIKRLREIIELQIAAVQSCKEFVSAFQTDTTALVRLLIRERNCFRTQRLTQCKRI